MENRILNNLAFLAVLLLCVFPIQSCDRNNGSDFCDSSIPLIIPGPEAEQQIQEAMLDVKTGNQICFAEGTFEISNTLTMDNKSNIVITGAGKNLSVISFSSQTGGGDGILITNSSRIVVKDLTILDTQGDGLKFSDSDSIVMKNLIVKWSGEPSAENGAYGLYPVLSSNILIDSSYVFGASDAGIYVGQSDKAIVKRSTAEGNVAGIQIENTTNADVFDNISRDNAAGIMVFDLPNLTRNGENVRIFNNVVEFNGRDNFAPSGIVSELPAGTGILTMSTDGVEVFDNTLIDNNLIGTAVFSFNSMIALGAIDMPIDTSYNPINVYIHNNSYRRTNDYVFGEGQSDLGNVLLNLFGDNPIPDIIIDGFFSPEAAMNSNICMRNNTNQSFVNLNIPNDFPNNLSFDSSVHDCTIDPLPKVEINVPTI